MPGAIPALMRLAIKRNEVEMLYVIEEWPI